MNKILIDSSVWINHFKKTNDKLTELLKKGIIRTHPLIIGEIALGTIKNRTFTLETLNQIKQVNQVTHPDVMTFIEKEKLYGQGCGITDITILASTLITPNTELWTIDKKLFALAKRFKIAFEPVIH